MSTSRDQYKQQAIPLIQNAIVQSRSLIDIEQQRAIRAVFPWKITNLVAWQVWYPLATSLREYFYNFGHFNGWVYVQPKEL